MEKQIEEVTREIVNDVEESLGTRFSQSEVSETIDYTLRKLEVIHKGADYFRLLFENELRDAWMRRTINRQWPGSEADAAIEQ